MMMRLVCSALFGGAALSATVLRSQTPPQAASPALTISVIETGTHKPLHGVEVLIRYNFLEPRRAKKTELFYAKTNGSGIASFRYLPATSECFSISVWSVSVGNDELEPVICPLGRKSGLANPTFEGLPQSVTVHAHRRSLGERLKMIYPGP